MIRNDVGVTLHLVFGRIDTGPCIPISLQFYYSHGQRPSSSFSVRCEQIPISRIAIGMVKKSHTASTSYVLVQHTDEQNYRPLRY